MYVAGDVLRRGLPEEELHVLAVDDSLVDRKVIEKLLKRLSCKVTTVDSARSALQLLGLMDDGGEDSKCRSSDTFVDDEMKINLIMTDYSMPGMTGYELLKKIKESAAFREIPVVIMSSERVLPRINRCLAEGAEEFLSKPVRFADVKRLRDFVMRSVETSCHPTISAMKRRRQEREGEDTLPCVESGSDLPSEYQPTKSPLPAVGRIPSPSGVGVAVLSPKRMKVRSGDLNYII